MSTDAAFAVTERARLLAELKARIAVPVASGEPLLPFGLEAIDSRLGQGGLEPVASMKSPPPRRHWAMMAATVARWHLDCFMARHRPCGIGATKR